MNLIRWIAFGTGVPYFPKKIATPSTEENLAFFYLPAREMISLRVFLSLWVLHFHFLCNIRIYCDRNKIICALIRAFFPVWCYAREVCSRQKLFLRFMTLPISQRNHRMFLNVLIEQIPWIRMIMELLIFITFCPSNFRRSQYQTLWAAFSYQSLKGMMKLFFRTSTNHFQLQRQYFDESNNAERLTLWSSHIN